MEVKRDIYQLWLHYKAKASSHYELLYTCRYVFDISNNELLRFESFNDFGLQWKQNERDLTHCHCHIYHANFLFV